MELKKWRQPLATSDNSMVIYKNKAKLRRTLVHIPVQCLVKRCDKKVRQQVSPL